MPRSVPTMLLVLAILAGCSPADGAEPAGVASNPTSGPTSGEPSAMPVAVAAATASPVPASPTSAIPASPVPAPASTTPAATAGPLAQRVPDPTPTPTPAADAAASTAPKSGPFAISLATRADFVRQYTFDWCVGASIQMARSIITGEREESRASQERYWEMARARTIGSPYGGANPAGWAAALTDLGLGEYRLVSLLTFDAAVLRAARALAQTGRPVGLVMWAGRHAWVMTGFEATADPRTDRDARVTRVRVMDPLYPHGSRWGRSPAPNSLVSPKRLARQFVERNRPDYDFGVAPGWLLVLPVD